MPFKEYETKKACFLEKLKSSSKQLQLLERNTVDQSKCDEWRQNRKIRLTASNFGKVAKLRDTTSRANTVKYILYELFRGNSATRYITYYKLNVYLLKISFGNDDYQGHTIRVKLFC